MRTAGPIPVYLTPLDYWTIHLETSNVTPRYYFVDFLGVKWDISIMNAQAKKVWKKGSGPTLYTVPFFSRVSRPALVHTQLPIKWVPGIKRQRREAYAHLYLVPMLRMVELNLRSAICLHGKVLYYVRTGITQTFNLWITNRFNMRNLTQYLS
jgi:hypothetical protein